MTFLNKNLTNTEMNRWRMFAQIFPNDLPFDAPSLSMLNRRYLKWFLRFTTNFFSLSLIDLLLLIIEQNELSTDNLRFPKKVRNSNKLLNFVLQNVFNWWLSGCVAIPINLTLHWCWVMICASIKLRDFAIWLWTSTYHNQFYQLKNFQQTLDKSWQTQKVDLTLA